MDIHIYGKKRTREKSKQILFFYFTQEHNIQLQTSYYIFQYYTFIKLYTTCKGKYQTTTFKKKKKHDNLKLLVVSFYYFIIGF